MGVHDMPKETYRDVQGTGGERRLLLGTLFVHNDHVSGGQSTSVGCHVCNEGLDGTVATAPPEREKIPMAEGDGKDKEGDRASSSGDRTREWPN